MTTINEPGLYQLNFESRKPAAKRFRKEVTAVFPDLRRVVRRRFRRWQKARTVIGSSTSAPR